MTVPVFLWEVCSPNPVKNYSFSVLENQPFQMQEKKLMKINPLHSTEGHFKILETCNQTAGNPVRFPRKRKGSKPPFLALSTTWGGEVPSSHGDSDMSEPEDRTLWRKVLKRPGGKQKKQEQRRVTWSIVLRYYRMKYNIEYSIKTVKVGCLKSRDGEEDKSFVNKMF